MDWRHLELTVYELTSVVAASSADALDTIELLYFCAHGAVPDADLEHDASLVLQIKLKNRGLVDFLEFAIRFCSWTELLDYVVLLEMDFEQHQQKFSK